MYTGRLFVITPPSWISCCIPLSLSHCVRWSGVITQFAARKAEGSRPSAHPTECCWLHHPIVGIIGCSGWRRAPVDGCAYGAFTEQRIRCWNKNSRRKHRQTFATGTSITASRLFRPAKSTRQTQWMVVRGIQKVESLYPCRPLTRG